VAGVITETVNEKKQAEDKGTFKICLRWVGTRLSPVSPEGPAGGMKRKDGIKDETIRQDGFRGRGQKRQVSSW